MTYHNILGTTVLVRAHLGVTVKHAVAESIKLAAELSCPVNLEFNGKLVVCVPGNDVEERVRFYLEPRKN